MQCATVTDFLESNASGSCQADVCRYFDQLLGVHFEAHKTDGGLCIADGYKRGFFAKYAAGAGAKCGADRRQRQR